jgi:phospholipase/carboxylesterase
VRLGLGKSRDGYLYVPKPGRDGQPLPLIVFLHGAAGNAAQADILLPLAEKHGVLVLAIDSRASTWDLIQGGFGPDVAFLDSALSFTFERLSVERERIALAGFSDGGSYALSLGLANPQLFANVLAFSPGFARMPESRGDARVFITHGRQDAVLPIERCSRRVVRRLESSGYSVDYREFDGAHTVPSDMLRAGFDWLLR